MAYQRHAVLVADVVNSTKLAHLRAVLSRKLRSVSAAHMAERRIRLPYEVTAGDEMQTLASDLEQVPILIFELRRRFRPLGLRIGIGIGEIPGRIEGPVNRLNGEAFVFAREALQNVHDAKVHHFEVLTGFRSADTKFDGIANTLYGLHDTLVQGVSEKQWETMNAYLEKRSLDAAARALDVNISTVSRNLKRGYLRQMQETAAMMKNLIEWHFS
jgi:hypothetical protein